MRAGWIAIALLATACVFRDAPEPRFFRPESAALAGDAGATSGSEGVPLRLRPVVGAPLLRERIVWRASPVEYGLYDQRRWSDLPARYVERALANVLRATPAIRLTDAPGVAALRVEVIAFDEVLAPARVANVSLAVALTDTDRFRLLERTFSAEEPIANEQPATTAQAMGRALDRAVADVASAVAETLRVRPTPAP